MGGGGASVIDKGKSVKGKRKKRERVGEKQRLRSGRGVDPAVPGIKIGDLEQASTGVSERRYKKASRLFPGGVDGLDGHRLKRRLVSL